MVANDDAYLKRINLHNQVVNGTYILKIKAEIGQDTYIQSVKFTVDSRPVVQIGNTVVTQDKFERAIIIDMGIVLFFIIGILVLVIFELRRVVVYHSIDEGSLSRHGYFRK